MSFKPYQLFTINRVIGYKLAPHLAKTFLTPNHITSMVLVFGIISSYFYAQSTRIGMIWGAFFFHLAFLCDVCDGQVARIKQMTSKSGEWFDFIADVGVDFCLWIGLTIASFKITGSYWFIALGAGACIASLLNLKRNVTNRRKHPKPENLSEKHDPHAPPEYRDAVQALSNDGDPILLVWIASLLGYPQWFLVAGFLYINALWLFGTEPTVPGPRGE